LRYRHRRFAGRTIVLRVVTDAHACLYRSKSARPLWGSGRGDCGPLAAGVEGAFFRRRRSRIARKRSHVGARRCQPCPGDGLRMVPDGDACLRRWEALTRRCPGIAGCGM
jgi:hypothetical protein